MRTDPIKRTKQEEKQLVNKAKMTLALIIAFISVYFFFFKILFF